MTASRKTELESLQWTIKKLTDELEQEQHSIDSLSHSMDELEGVITQIRYMQGQAKASEDVYKATIKEVQGFPIPPAVGMSCPPVTFTIDNFKKRMATNDHWLSSPFYTHVGGYKMCLSVYTNRSKIFVCINFMTGEFDDHLTWPFPGGIFTITAMKQRSSRYNRSVHVEMCDKHTRQMRVKIDGSHGEGLGQSLVLTNVDRHILGDFIVNDGFKIMVYRMHSVSSTINNKDLASKLY